MAGSRPWAKLSGAFLAKPVPPNTRQPAPSPSFLHCSLWTWAGTELDPESVCSNRKRIVFLPWWRCFLLKKLQRALFTEQGAGPVCGHSAVCPVLSEACSRLRGLLFWKRYQPEPCNSMALPPWVSVPLPAAYKRPLEAPGITVNLFLFLASWTHQSGFSSSFAVPFLDPLPLCNLIILSARAPQSSVLRALFSSHSQGEHTEFHGDKFPLCAEEFHMLSSSSGFALNSRFL